MENFSIQRVKQFFLILFFANAIGVVKAQNALPLIENIVIEIDNTNNQVIVSADISDTDSDSLRLSVFVSNNDGLTYLVPATFSGDTGVIYDFSGRKTLTWDYPVTVENFIGYKVKFIADDFFEIDINELIDQVNEDSLYSYLSSIIGSRNEYTSAPTDGSGILGLIRARDYIQKKYSKMQVHRRIQAVNYAGIYQIENMIARKAGNIHEDSTIVLCAHYDTQGSGPGADDNGSGVAGLLESARILSQYQFKHNIRFVGFDAEESGYIGAKAYVHAADGSGIRDYETIKAAFNWDMIGYTDSTDVALGTSMFNVANQTSWSLGYKLDATVQSYLPELSILKVNLNGNGDAGSPMRRSDHRVFWDEGIPALFLTDGSFFRNPNYHTVADLINTLDFRYMALVVKATIAITAQLAEIQHATVLERELGPPLSTSNEKELQDVEIVPSPSSGIFKVYAEEPVSSVSVIRLVSTGGVIAFEKQIGLGSSVIEVDASHLASGLYILVWSTEDRLIAKDRVVVISK